MIHSVTVDYGGTWTRFEARNRNGKIVRFQKIQSVPLPRLKKTIRAVISGWKVKNLHELTIGARSVWARSKKKWLYDQMKSFAERVTVMSDIELAHSRAFKGKPGILLLAGTGSIALGMNASGKMARAGGLGPLKGDEGSGFWIGKVYCEKILKNRKTRSVRDCAGTAEKAIRRAKAGDLESKKIILEAQGHLLRLVLEVHRKLKGSHLPLRLAGGLFENDYFRKGFLSLRRAADSAL